MFVCEKICVHRCQKRKWVHKVDREMGREGSFQLVAMKVFLYNENPIPRNGSIVATPKRKWVHKVEKKREMGREGSFQLVAMRRHQGRQASRPFQGKWREDDSMVLWCFNDRMMIIG